MHFNDLLQRIVERGASDVHLHVGLPAMSRVNGKLNPVTESKITPRFTEALLDLMARYVPPPAARWTTLERS